MKIMLCWATLFFTSMLWATDPRVDNAEKQQINRLDGSSISAGELEKYVAAVMDSAGVMGLQMAIINDGKIAYTHEFGLKSRTTGFAPDSATIFAGCSFSKPVFAFLVMQLVVEGKLDLDRPLTHYLGKPIEDYPEWNDLKSEDRLRMITARRVLTHTTGLPNLRAQAEGGKLSFIYPPGERFSYSGEGFSFLQFVVEQITGKNLELLARERIFVPLDMRRTSYIWSEAFEANHADGHTEEQRRIKVNRYLESRSGGSLVTTATDFARFVTAVLNAEILQQSAIDLMLVPQMPVLSMRMFGPLTQETTEDNKLIHLSWGLGWGRFDTIFGRAFFHTGHDVGWENYTVTYLDKKIGIVLLSNSSNFESIAQRVVERAIGDRFSPFEWLGFQPFDPSIPPPPPEPERKTVPIDSMIYGDVVGEYEVQSGDFILLKVKEGHLVGSGDGKFWDEVMAVSATEFFIDGKPYVFTFSRNSAGMVIGLVISYQRMKIPVKKIK